MAQWCERQGQSTVRWRYRCRATEVHHQHHPVPAGHCQREPHTGRTPAQVRGLQTLSEKASIAAKESPVLQPIDAGVVNRMLDQKRADLGRDTLTEAEYTDTLRDYHAQRGAGVAAAEHELKLSVREQAISYVMSRGYDVDVATVIVNKEGAEKILKSAGIEPS